MEEIMEEVGCGDSAAFYRNFKRRYGVTTARHTESSEDKETVIEKLEKIQKKGHKKQILSMLKNTSKKDMMSTTKSNKTKNENQRFVV